MKVWAPTNTCRLRLAEGKSRILPWTSPISTMRGTDRSPLRTRCSGTGRSISSICRGTAHTSTSRGRVPYFARFLRGLAAYARVIATDRRGWGLSDRFAPDAVPPLEALTDDLQTVMDAAGSARAVVFGSWDCGALAMLFAATHPGRAAGLILCDTFPTFAVTEDTPTMPTSRGLQEIDAELHEHWGRDFGDEAWGGPPRPRDPRERDWFKRYTRASVAPGGLIAEGRRLVELDARPVLPSIHAPTLVVGFRNGRGVLDPAISRVLADADPECQARADRGGGRSGRRWLVALVRSRRRHPS